MARPPNRSRCRKARSIARSVSGDGFPAAPRGHAARRKSSRTPSTTLPPRAGARSAGFPLGVLVSDHVPPAKAVLAHGPRQMSPVRLAGNSRIAHEACDPLRYLGLPRREVVERKPPRALGEPAERDRHLETSHLVP